jgi:DNA-binding NarL/FixJ family response regulator
VKSCLKKKKPVVTFISPYHIALNLSTMKKIRLAIADDYAVFREGLHITLSVDENIEVVTEADNGAELLKAIETNLPDVVIMDYKMPVMDGMEATKRIKELYPHIKVLVISMYEDPKFIQHLLSNGADAYLLKNAEPDEIRQAVYNLVEKTNTD